MTFSRTHAPRLTAGFGTAALVASVGFFASSRPAHTAGGPLPVAVANTVASRDAENPGRQPFALRLIFHPSQPATFDVPAGKRLVLTQLYAHTASQTAVGLRYISEVNRQTTEIQLPFTDGTANTGFVRFSNQQVTSYADGGTSVEIIFFDTGNSSVVVNLTGYFVDVP